MATTQAPQTDLPQVAAMKRRRKCNGRVEDIVLPLSRCFEEDHEWSTTELSLSTDEQLILQRQLATPEARSGLRMLFTYASPLDHIILAGSALCAIAGGVCLPLMSLFFGQFAGAVQDVDSASTSMDHFSHRVTQISLYLVYIGIAVFLTVSVSTFGFIHVGQRISNQIRRQLLKACLRQNIAFYDDLGAGQITSWISEDTVRVQEAISEKLALLLSAVATFVSAFVVSFVVQWKLTLILCSIAVSILLAMGIGSRFIVKYGVLSMEACGLASTFAEEVFGSVRTTKACGTQEKLTTRYDTHLAKAESLGVRMQTALGFQLGFTFMASFLGYGLAFWQGAHYLTTGQAPLSAIVTILLAINTGSWAVGSVSSHFKVITKGIAATANVSRVVTRVSPLDPSSRTGARPNTVQGRIELRNIRMVYPSRPTVAVLDNFSFTIKPGQHTAIVGASGSGKSTIIGLLERFYEPVGGQVLFDGYDITTLNLQWLRQQMSLVSQEPVLFNTSIYDNIAYGLIGSEFEHKSTEEQELQVMRAAELANVHDFVSSLPHKYHTNVGARGVSLSGGQKQRIAIARAIVSQPKVLLLDEATAALDVKMEAEVQAALEAASKGRTTVTIAHRLSTVQSADHILVMDAGRIVEQGTHQQLIQQQGAYSRLVAAQKFTERRSHLEQDPRHDAHPQTGMKISQSMQPTPCEDGNAPSEHTMEHSRKYEEQPPTAEFDSGTTAAPKHSLWPLVKMIAQYNAPDWPWMTIGLCCSVVCGAASPVSAVFLGKNMVALNDFKRTHDTQQTVHVANFWSLMYVVLAISQLISFTVEGFAFALCSERLVRRVKHMTFKTILGQDTQYFDRKATGSLTAFLATTTTDFASLSGSTLGTVLNACTTLIAALAISLALGWKLALVTATTIPVLLICGYCRFGVLRDMQARTKQAYMSSATHASEAISAIRVIASLGQEEDVLRCYQIDLEQYEARNLFPAFKSSVLYSTSQCLVFLCMALGFWYGGKLLASGEYQVLQFYICFAVIVFGAESAGLILGYVRKSSQPHQPSQLLWNVAIPS